MKTSKKGTDDEVIHTSMTLTRQALTRLDNFTAATGQTRSGVVSAMIVEQLPETEADELGVMAASVTTILVDLAKTGRDVFSIGELKISEIALRACLRQRRVVIPGYSIQLRDGIVRLAVKSEVTESV